MSNNFNPGFDREKEAFIELANRGDGLTPINYLYAKEANFENMLSAFITGGTADVFTLYSSGIYSNNIQNLEDIITQKLKWNNPGSDYYVGFTGGNLTKSTLWTLPLEDGTNGQVLATNGTGVLSFITPSIAPSLPPLTENKLWIGDVTNTAVETQTINLENLPPLYQTIVPNPLSLDFVGQVYEGTSSGVPKASNIVADIFADVALINARFLSAKFVLNDGNVALQALMPASQFLSNVTSGLPIQISTNPLTPGKIEVAELPYNYLWVGDAQGRVSSQPNIILSNLPNLTDGKIWKGDGSNRPIEADINYAPNDAKYILQQANNDLINAQALDLLGLGI